MITTLFLSATSYNDVTKLPGWFDGKHFSISLLRLTVLSSKRYQSGTPITVSIIFPVTKTQQTYDWLCPLKR